MEDYNETDRTSESFWASYTQSCRQVRNLPHGKIQTMIQWAEVLSLAKNGNPAPDRKVVKTDAEWRRQLTPEEYRVTRQAGTERAFSSEMCSLFEPGIYSCRCCDTVLFDGSNKFESGTGWPSFTPPAAANAIAYRFDGPAFLKRVETICNTCDAHLGHVFPDGPAPTGLRCCMNAVALKKVADANFDMTKSIPLGSEKRVLKLQARAYNAFNHSEFNAMNTGIQFNPATNAVSNATAVGLPTGTLPARVMAFSARLQF
jgi:peptide-methionine (R)-S-oxide reductase